MRIHLQKEHTFVDVEHQGDVASLLVKLEVNPEVVLVVVDGTLVTLDEDVTNAEKIELLSVISGG